MVSIQDEIQMRSERDPDLHNLRPLRDKTGGIPAYTRIFLIGVPGVLKHLKPRYTLENEIGMNFGNKFSLLPI